MQTEQFLLTAAERRLDVLTLRPDAPGRHPVAVLVAGSRSGAEVWRGWGAQLVAQGIAVVGVAQPGFGASTGAWDFAGPATLAALDALLVWVRRQPWVKPLRVGFGGYSSGATCAALLAARHAFCHVLVGAAGVYDLGGWWDERAQRSSWALSDLDAGVTAAALAQRSPIAVAAQIRCPVRLIHGANDDVVPVAQAEAFAAALAAAGNAPTLLVEAGRGHAALPAALFVAGFVQGLGE